MAGNLIDNQVKKYQQNIAFQSQQQSSMSAPNIGTQYVNTASEADTFTSSQPHEPNDNKKTLFVIGSWLGLNKLMDVFNNNCTKDDYSKTLMSKLGNFGDRVTNKYKANPVVTSTKAVFSSAINRAKNFIDSKPMLSAIFNTPTKPENSNVISFMETQQHADLKEAASTISGYLDDIPKSFKEAGATKAEIQALKAKYGTNIFGGIKNKTKALQELQFNRIGAPAGLIDTLDPKNIAETLKNMKIKHLGLEPSNYEKVLSNPTKYSNIITEMCRRGGKNAKAIHGRYSFIPFLGIFTKRSTNLSMSYNKLISGSKHTSALGKSLAKLPKIIMRGLTFGGGKLNSLLVALGIGTALYNATKAPKEQKVGTAVAGGVDAVSWILSMPLAIKIMHAVNGIQYTGLSKTEVGNFRKALKAFNKDVKAGKFTTEAAYNTALDAVNKLKEVKAPQGKFTKVMKKIGSLLSVALENPAPFKEATAGLTGSAKTSAVFRNIKRMLPNIGKNCIGYPLRFALYMVAFTPIVDKLISSVTSAIFGHPYEPEEEAQKEAKNITAPNNPQRETITNQSQEENNKQAQNIKENKPIDIDKLPNDNLIKREVNGDHVIKEPEIRYIPSEDCEIEGIASPYDKVERNYIPSEENTITSSYSSDKATVDNAILKADKAEARALEVLNGIY